MDIILIGLLAFVAAVAIACLLRRKIRSSSSGAGPAAGTAAFGPAERPATGRPPEPVEAPVQGAQPRPRAAAERVVEVEDLSDTHFAPPSDRLFQDLMHRAIQGEVPVYGTVIEVGKVAFRRSADSFRPETLEGGQAVLHGMWQAWQSGDAVQPWLYVRDGAYIVADDYFWLALIERGKPETVAAQVLGDPLEAGLIEKTGPLPPKFIRSLLGFRGG